MKRNIACTLLFLIGFLAGWMVSCILLQNQFSRRQALLREKTLQELDQWKESIKVIGGRFYEDRFIYRPDMESDTKAHLEAFIPSEEKEFISLAYFGGFSKGDKRFTLTGNGELYSEFQGQRQLIARIPNDECKSFFRQVITSGISNYSEGVMLLKMDIIKPKKYLGVTDAPTTQIEIHIPKLDIEKKIQVVSPEIEYKMYPEIIELRLIEEIKSNILKLIPENYEK